MPTFQIYLKIKPFLLRFNQSRPGNISANKAIDGAVFFFIDGVPGYVKGGIHLKSDGVNWLVKHTDSSLELSKLDPCSGLK